MRKALFWCSAGALAWTHVGYPLAAAALARLRPRPIRKDDVTPDVTVVIAAHDEESVIERRVENLLALEYPAAKLAVVVASDASADATDEIVDRVAERDSRVRLLRFPRAGKTATQDAAVRETQGDVIAFSDANSLWKTDALRKLVRSFADPDVAYVCGRLELEQPDGRSRESIYWRYELWLRESESNLAGVTGGNGAIYAVRRSDYLETDPRLGHDFGFPYRMAQRGRRAVYEPEAIATEKAATDSEDEYGRRVRMHSQGWLHVLSGRVFEGGEPLFLFEVVSHRVHHTQAACCTSFSSRPTPRSPGARASTGPHSQPSSGRSGLRRPAVAGSPFRAQRWPTTTSSWRPPRSRASPGVSARAREPRGRRQREPARRNLRGAPTACPSAGPRAASA